MYLWSSFDNNRHVYKIFLGIFIYKLNVMGCPCKEKRPEPSKQPPKTPPYEDSKRIVNPSGR